MRRIWILTVYGFAVIGAKTALEYILDEKRFNDQVKQIGEMNKKLSATTTPSAN